ncbi:hypothetical protein HN51_037186 [Arachis hypogaea]|uniref:Kelch-like protein n=1 Tax=Arachis hypogaea TaxID=3818 RepID=A0A444ZX87_ARAHY|nr:kelch-like protein 8 [Arachis ipaensis]XP_025641190.1 kelch-like protein 8 [Arachis hypogaea]QHO02714.1 Kelch-like protein [Arachis hypogaea]RYR18674.1 hypothetical protein Ahy_B03g063296 [Arachis hypogaea]
MGSLSCLSRPMEDDFLSNYAIVAVFCPTKPTTDNKGIVPNSMELFNPSTNTWSHVTSIPGLIEGQILKAFSMVSLGDSVYIIGGLVCHKERVHVSDDSAELVDVGIHVSPNVLRYNITTNQWFHCAPLGMPRYDFACTICNNRIYVAGGKSKLASAHGISSAEVYDPSLDTWTPLPSMHILRYKCVGVTWQGKVYIIGGFTMPSLVERSSAEVYDTLAKKWDLVAGMWQLDVPPNQIVAVNDSLFSSGDCLNAWKGHVEAYDGKLWNEVEGSQKPSLSTLETNYEDWPHSQRSYLTMAPIGTQLFFLAGYKTGNDYDETERSMSLVHLFDTTRGAWRSLEPVELEGEKELCSHCCVVQLS